MKINMTDGDSFIDVPKIFFHPKEDFNILYSAIPDAEFKENIQKNEELDEYLLFSSIVDNL